MSGSAAAYLVVRRDDGFGEVFPLAPGERYTLGRAATNRYVLKDELCSREHAEFYHADGRWRLRDLNSLNGTRINGDRLDTEWELSPGDEVGLGHTNLLFVEDMAQLPALVLPPEPAEGVSITKRLSKTRFLTPLPDESGDGRTPAPPHTLHRALALLYRLALEMGSAGTYADLLRVVLDGLLDGTAADAGGVLTVQDGGGLETTAFRQRDPADRSPPRFSQFVSNEVVRSREAVLAEDVAGDRHLRNRDSLTEFGAKSLLCAPVVAGGRVVALVHLYCTYGLKPLTADDLEFTMAVALQLGNAVAHLRRQASLTAENRSLRDQLRVESELVGASPAVRELEDQIAHVAATNATVLVRGESGTGKELVARAIHYSSPRREGPFVCLNCAALTETLLESELFGHEKGAFTGATDKKVGKFEAADGGTIFLDEIGEMNPSTQAKLLRVLEGHPFERVGGHAPIRVDVRVVAATNRPLEQAIQEGRFRRDLFYRLQVVEIRVPPLRDRRSDTPLLADHFLRRFVGETGRKVTGFTPAALKRMEAYHWPGNVRELRNVIERAVALGKGPVLDVKDLWLSSLELEGPDAADGAFRPVSLEESEKDHIRRTLDHTDWNKSQAATILKIERSTLDRKIKLYELKR
jgi:Nif-specific regulatory protein